MFNFNLWLILTVLCLPGIWLMSVHTTNVMNSDASNSLSRTTLLTITFVQTLLITSASAASGAYFTPKVGLMDEFLLALSNGHWLPEQLYLQLGIGIAAGLPCGLVWVAVYYGYVRKRLDPATVRISESQRLQMGLWTRVASGGMTEEIIFRWGFLSLTMWALSFVTDSITTAFWFGLFITGVLFGLAHIPGNVETGATASPLLIATSVLGNLWVTLFCGYGLLKFGLLTAITIHALFHVIWYPFERRVQSRAAATPT
ncbi:type II CAAX prenyl endopeptidase Rce1 family protein [Paenibacillus sp. YYML68]|uniref:CPBP family glutamic-type intramembrane protease n=1 Tax=Paenibacillus sp. YYML68 TaxID=2909250 RepID=UPI0024925C64|nr:CPBP family glutamic-type intramembrane protease [Paenibacillus sp. YYML68]